MKRPNASIIALVSVFGCAHPHAPATTAASAPAQTVIAPATPPACERGSHEGALPPSAELSSANLIAQHGTGLDAYQRQDGVWLPHAPVMVNEDFDFGTAMALDGIGAGIAARKRMDGNAKSASELSTLRLAAGEEERLDALRACGVHVWGVIWTKGGERELRVVTDVFAMEGGKWVVREHGVEVRELSDHAASDLILTTAGVRVPPVRAVSLASP